MRSIAWSWHNHIVKCLHTFFSEKYTNFSTDNDQPKVVISTCLSTNGGPLKITFTVPLTNVFSNLLVTRRFSQTTRSTRVLSCIGPLSCLNRNTFTLLAPTIDISMDILFLGLKPINIKNTAKPIGCTFKWNFHTRAQVEKCLFNLFSNVLILKVHNLG